MKTYKSSDLTHKRAEVLKEAKANGVIIQECNTNGDVRCEYVMMLADKFSIEGKDFYAYGNGGLIDCEEEFKPLDFKG